MKAPFNLIKAFSINSLLVTTLLTLGISQVLSHTLSRLLLERDKQLAMIMFEEEISELEYGEPDEEDEESSEPTPIDLDNIHEEVDEELSELAEEIYGAYALDLIRKDRTVAWSTDEDRIGSILEDSRLAFVFQGNTLVTFDEPLSPETYYSSIYIPFEKGGHLVAAFKLYRKDASLYQDAELLKYKVYVYCILFGTIFYFSMIFIIVPASRRLHFQHEALLEAKERLIESQRLSAIGEVCGAVAHGLKNPIANVRAAVQLLSLRNISEEKRGRITKDILCEVDRLSTRLNHLLNFIRPFKPDFENMLLSGVLNNSIRSLAWKAEQEKIHFELDVPEDLTPSQIDSALMEEALLIVMGNAMDASEPKSKIQCRVREDSTQHTIVIQDYGKGIPKEVQPKIFNQFFTTRSKGIGLGLALCKKVLDLHNGSIQVESEEGEGTTVCLNIPKSKKV